VFTKHLFAATWLRLDNPVASSLRVSSTEGHSPTENSQPPVIDIEGGIKPDTATLLNLELDRSFRTQIVASALSCAGCEISSAFLPGRVFRVAFKDATVVRYGLDEKKVGTADAVTIIGQLHDIILVNGDRVDYGTNSGYMLLNGNPINPTMWDLIPIELKKAAFLSALGGLGLGLVLKRSIRGILDRALGRLGRGDDLT